MFTPRGFERACLFILVRFRDSLVQVGFLTLCIYVKFFQVFLGIIPEVLSVYIFYALPESLLSILLTLLIVIEMELAISSNVYHNLTSVFLTRCLSRISLIVCTGEYKLVLAWFLLRVVASGVRDRLIDISLSSLLQRFKGMLNGAPGKLLKKFAEELVIEIAANLVVSKLPLIILGLISLLTKILRF